MAKKKVSTEELVRCDGFWQPEKKGDQVHGVLLSMSMVADKMNEGEKRPLYTVAALEKNPPRVFMDKKSKKLDKGQVIGVNGAYKIDVAIKKLGLHTVLGHEIWITFEGKIDIDGGNRTMKVFTFEWDDEPSKLFQDRVVRSASRSTNGAQGSTGNFDVGDDSRDPEIPFG
jgi:hypothetical protein